MGQQQQAVLVLSLVVAGFAVMVAWTTFNEKAEDLTLKAISFEAVRIAEAALVWKAKPQPFGGGRGVVSLTGLRFEDIGYKSTNEEGRASHTTTSFRNISLVASKRPYVTVRSKRHPDLRVQLFIYGPSVKCFQLRKEKILDGMWMTADLKAYRDAVPTDCKPWW